MITGIGSLNMGFASLTLDFRAQRESWALNIGFGPLTLDFRAQRESKAILCLFSVAVCFSGRIKAEILMPKQPAGRQNAGRALPCLLHTAAALRSAHLDSRLMLTRRIKLEITLTRSNSLNLLRNEPGGPGDTKP